MILRMSQLRRVGWFALLTLAVVVFLAMSFHVNAIKSDVQLKERRIVALERKKTLLETEFQTRANQQQLADWNAIEFGYQAPTASQYLENDRQLAELGSPGGPGDPEPIRVARAGKAAAGELPAMVSPLTGKPINGTLGAEGEVVAVEGGAIENVSAADAGETQSAAGSRDDTGAPQ